MNHRAATVRLREEKSEWSSPTLRRYQLLADLAPCGSALASGLTWDADQGVFVASSEQFTVYGVGLVNQTAGDLGLARYAADRRVNGAGVWEAIDDPAAIHVAVPPCGVGIPARVGDKPGHTECCIFRLQPINPGDADYNAATAPDVRLAPVPCCTGVVAAAPDETTTDAGTSTTPAPGSCIRKEHVYNFSLNAIPPRLPPNEIYWPVYQDAYGRWFVDPGPSAASTTTTAYPPGGEACRGNCVFIWSSGANFWQLVTNGCGTTTTSTTTTAGGSTTTTPDPCLCPTTTSTTTTSPNPCGCPITNCHCVYPDHCGAPGECFYSQCSSLTVLATPSNVACTTTTCACTTTTADPATTTGDPATSTTTTCGPNSCSTTTTNCPCTTTTTSSTTSTTTTSCNCATTSTSCAPTTSTPPPGCGCACCPPGWGCIVQCTGLGGGCGGGQICVDVCLPPPPPPPPTTPCPSFCGGTTDWACNSNNEWIYVSPQPGCSSCTGTSNCLCEWTYPSVACTCGDRVTTNCGWVGQCRSTNPPQTTIDPGGGTTPAVGCGGVIVPPACLQCYPTTTSSTTTTTTTTGCGADCKFQWNGSSVWNQLTNPCAASCACPSPGLDGHEACEVTWTPCQTTTSSTTSTTSTTSPTTTTTSTTTTPPPTTTTSSTTSTTTTTTWVCCAAAAGECVSGGTQSCVPNTDCPEVACASYATEADCIAACPFTTTSTTTTTTTTPPPTTTSSTTTTTTSTSTTTSSTTSTTTTTCAPCGSGACQITCAGTAGGWQEIPGSCCPGCSCDVTGDPPGSIGPCTDANLGQTVGSACTGSASSTTSSTTTT